MYFGMKGLRLMKKICNIGANSMIKAERGILYSTVQKDKDDRYLTSFKFFDFITKQIKEEFSCVQIPLRLLQKMFIYLRSLARILRRLLRKSTILFIREVRFCRGQGFSFVSVTAVR